MGHAGRVADVFCHSPESWVAMWDGKVFAKGKVRVDATMKWEDRGFWQLQWSVVRL